MHGVWLAQGGIKRLQTIGIQLVINLIKHGTNLTSTLLGQSFNLSYCKLGNTKKKKGCNFETVIVSYMVSIEIKDMTIFSASQIETNNKSLN